MSAENESLKNIGYGFKHNEIQIMVAENGKYCDTILNLISKINQILLSEPLDKGNMQRLEVLIRNIQLLKNGE